MDSILDQTSCVFLLLGSALMTAPLGVLAWRRRKVRGAAPFALTVLAVTLWSAGYGLEIAVPDPTIKLFLTNLEYLSIAIIPVGWLVMALQYCGYESWLSRRRLALLFAIPTVTAISVWTDGFYGMMRRSMQFDYSAPYPILAENYGPWFWVHTAYSYSILIVATLLLNRAVAKAPPFYRGQPLALLVGSIMPFLWNVAYIAGPGSKLAVDFTPVALGLGGVVAAWGLFRYRLFDIVPLAYDAIIESMSDAVVVMDARHQVVDMNPAARTLLAPASYHMIGRPADLLFAGYPQFVGLYRQRPGLSQEVNIGQGETPRCYDVQTSLLTDRRGGEIGCLVVFRDITERRRVEEALRESEERSRLLIENASVPIISYNLRGVVLLANSEVASILGKPLADIVGKEIGSIIPDPLASRIISRNARVAASGRSEANEDTIAIWGEERTFWNTAYPQRDAAGNVTAIVVISQDLTARKRMEQDLVFASFHDSLTSLYNRAYFEEEIRRLEASRAYPITVVSTDIDGLKPINDTRGHQAGDDLLRAYAGVLHGCLRESDVVARVGGDEFAILLPHTDRHTAEAICQRLEQHVASHNRARPELPLSISWGAETCEAGNTLDQAYKTADLNMYRNKLQRKASGRRQLVDTLLVALAAKDHVSGGHTRRVRELAARLGNTAGLNREEISDLSLLGEVHDLGKVGVPDSILFKPGPLTPEERQEVEQHSTIGYNIARSCPDLAHVAELILHHHEWWDGQGYPFGMKGVEIPLACRILAIVDAYDALTNDRPYRKAASRAEALAEIQAKAGSQFDPHLVPVFVQMLASEARELDLVAAAAGAP